MLGFNLDPYRLSLRPGLVWPAFALCKLARLGGVIEKDSAVLTKAEKNRLKRFPNRVRFTKHSIEITAAGWLWMKQVEDNNALVED